MPTINIDNLNIFFEQEGKSDKKIVFVHGNSLSSKLFDAQFSNETLLNNYELIRFDFPGFGQSEFASNTNTYSFPGFAKILVKLYNALKISNAILVGNSMGGHVILEALSELKGAKGIFINGTPPFGLPPAPDIFLPHPALPLFFKGQHTEQELDMLSKAMLFNEELFETVKTELKKSDHIFRDVWMPNMQSILPKDELEVVKNTSLPIAVVHGENDNLANGEYIKKVPFNNLWDHRVHIIPEAGHLPFLEQAGVYNALLSDFCYEQFHQDEV